MEVKYIHPTLHSLTRHSEKCIRPSLWKKAKDGVDFQLEGEGEGVGVDDRVLLITPTRSPHTLKTIALFSS